ncbi:MAG: hypothetical protein ABI113_11030 [Mucilaginibacter sp.]
MARISISLKKITFIAALILTAAFTAHAQSDTKTIGNKQRSGSANTSFDLVKGKQVGIKLNAGHKPVQLLKFNFTVESQCTDTIRFKVNIYEFNYITPGPNLATQDITGGIPQGKHHISINLEPYKIIAKKELLVAIEFLNDYHCDNHFAIGLFNGGTYHFENGVWKKLAVAGVDFNLTVRKVK